MTASMSRKGNHLGNAPMESFFGALKTGMVHRMRLRTRRKARAALFEYIDDIEIEHGPGPELAPQPIGGPVFDRQTKLVDPVRAGGQTGSEPDRAAR